MIRIDIKKLLHTQMGDIELKVNLNIKKGEFISITGPSGSGKTTLLRIIAGLERSKGEIIVEDKIWQNEKKFLPPQKREIGFVFQDYALFPNMSVIENLLFVKKDLNFAKELLHMVELDNLSNRYPAKLSGGQKQRVALARALMRKPKLLLMDEPFSALDIEIREKLQDMILKLHKKFDLTTIMVSHLPQEIYKLSNRIVTIKNGQIENIINSSEIVKDKIELQGEIIDIDQTYAIIAIGNKLIKINADQNYKRGEKVKVVFDSLKIKKIL